ncbi:MAG: hypothetical protein AVDCRST_MAG53-2304 [uncultured Solirubrobacteraceae bacterium]|uniref:Uncharacterized protein n=1 Tax=uncultured Solirubrobacteraceae bacterium TaxID=1162706 RepID=A0A6J4STT5_9ACTN|nr:MAG: hypothetical protein AVDCRST_MAG53-2304 [uncultured Solirubrobacteraceae bacterium]
MDTGSEVYCLANKNLYDRPAIAPSDESGHAVRALVDPRRQGSSA